jgi:endonuclease/exonuclease/phosphatase family metal-dependent hydrolase
VPTSATDGREAFSQFLERSLALKDRTAPAPRRRLAAFVAGVAAVVAVVAPAAAHADAPPGQVKVMTRNLYLGADLTPALEASGQVGLAIAAQGIWNNVHQTAFPTRAKLLAAEIADNKPDLVGLQEVALWRGDYDSQDGPLTAATTTEVDFLALLMKQLKKQGVDYRIVQKQQEMDIESPLSGYAEGCAGPENGSWPNRCAGDGRLTMRDVILANDSKKANVKTKFEHSAQYPDEDSLQVVVAGILPLVVHRGWEFTEANVRGTKFRFLNTHLEAFDNGSFGSTGQGEVREAQANDLVEKLGDPGVSVPGPATRQAAGTPVVAVGDYNSDDDTVGNDGDVLAYNRLTDPDDDPSTAGPLTELSTGPTAPGAEASCCFDGHNGTDGIFSGLLSDMTHQVDHVFVTNTQASAEDPIVPDATPVSTKVVGQDQSVHDKFGKWPSDHSGLVTKLQFPTP